MLTKLKELSTGAKVAIVAGIAAVAAIGVGVAVWQPWNRAEEPDPDPVVDQQEPTIPREPTEKGLSVKVSGEDVPCTLYEGTGWTIYVPEGWESKTAGANGAVFTAPDGAEMQVDFLPVDGGTGSFASLANTEDGGRQIQFCAGGGEGSPVVTGWGPKASWNRYEKLFTALAKTMTVGTQTPFAGSFTVPQEPDWQTADGYTVLFLGKDGIILDSEVQSAVEAYMRSWPAEDREIYSGQYRINAIEWAASYTGLTDGYIDVFRARVQYRLAEGGEEALSSRDGGVTVVDGWATLPDSVYLVLGHDGGDVETKQTVIAPEVEDWIEFAGRI